MADENAVLLFTGAAITLVWLLFFLRHLLPLVRTRPMDDNKKPLVLFAWVALGVAFVFGLFVWPTPYRYEHHKVYYSNQILDEAIYRINRLTGSAVKVVPPPPTSTAKPPPGTGTSPSRVY